MRLVKTPSTSAPRSALLKEITLRAIRPPPINTTQVAVIWAVTNGLLDEIEIEAIREWEAGFIDYMREQRSEIRAAIQETGKLDEETEKKLREAVEEYNRRFHVEHGTAPEEPVEAGA